MAPRNEKTKMTVRRLSSRTMETLLAALVGWSLAEAVRTSQMEYLRGPGILFGTIVRVVRRKVSLTLSDADPFGLR